MNDTIAAIRRAKTTGRSYFIWLALSASHSPYQKPPNNLHTRDSLPVTGGPRRAYSVDLYPTILNLAGITMAKVLPADAKVDGVSLMPFVANRATGDVRATSYADKFDLAGATTFERTVRDSHYELIERAPGLKWPVRESFDLAKDPYVKNSLVNKKLTATQKAKLDSLDGEFDRLQATR